MIYTRQDKREHKKARQNNKRKARHNKKISKLLLKIEILNLKNDNKNR